MSLSPNVIRMIAEARERLSLNRPLVADLDELSRCGDRINEMHRLVAENLREAEENKARFEKKQRQLAERRERLDASIVEFGMRQEEMREALRVRLALLYEEPEEEEGEFMEWEAN